MKIAATGGLISLSLRPCKRSARNPKIRVSSQTLYLDTALEKSTILGKWHKQSCVQVRFRDFVTFSQNDALEFYVMISLDEKLNSFVPRRRPKDLRSEKESNSSLHLCSLKRGNSGVTLGYSRMPRNDVIKEYLVLELLLRLNISPM